MNCKIKQEVYSDKCTNRKRNYKIVNLKFSHARNKVKSFIDIHLKGNAKH